MLDKYYLIALDFVTLQMITSLITVNSFSDLRKSSFHECNAH